MAKRKKSEVYELIFEGTDCGEALKKARAAYYFKNKPSFQLRARIYYQQNKEWIKGKTKEYYYKSRGRPLP